MRNSILILSALILFLTACQFNQKKPLDIQGHRGARGLYPENTIPAFVYAAELGVTTLELDVAVSADGKLVVSHEPWMSDRICSKPDGTPVTEEEEMRLNLYKMTYDEIKKYDCGSRGNTIFPQQKKMSASKPLLSEVIDTIEKLTKQKKLKPLHYNIETKSMPVGDTVYHPVPSEFAKLLFKEIKKHDIEKRVIVQSFDVRTLKEMDKLNRHLKLALLVEEGNFMSHLTLLGFDPFIYSPNYRLVNESLIKQAHDRGILVIPWTVNDTTKMKKLIDLGVDGIITDYPDIALQFIRR
jgi:glycerophosphoryl diester phosphodiesterase